MCQAIQLKASEQYFPMLLMRPNKAETAVHGCHCSGDMGVPHALGNGHIAKLCCVTHAA